MAKINPADVNRKDELDMRDSDVSPDSFNVIGKNIVTKLKSRGTAVPQIATGGDSRSNTPELIEALEKGIMAEGGAVISLGYDTPKPLAYVAGERFQTGAVAYITASHVNALFNGIKINFLYQQPKIPLSARTRIDMKDEVLQFYKNYLNGAFGSDSGNGKRIVVDSLCGTSSGIAQVIFEDLGFTVAGLHACIDRTFKRLEDSAPDPHELKNLKELMTLTRVWGDLGVALDGDADRVSIIGEDGEKITEDEVTMIIAEHLIAKAAKDPNIAEHLIAKAAKDPKVVYEIKSSNAVPETIRRAGGEPVMQKTGWQHIKKKMAESGAIFAGEISGHNFYGKQFYCVPNGDDGLYTALMISQILFKSQKPLSEFRRQFPIYFTSPELRVEYKEDRNPEVVKALKSAFDQDKYRLVVIDNDVRIERFGKDDWKSWAVARTSDTEPKKLTICFEGKTLYDLEEMIRTFLDKIPPQDSKLRDIVRNAYDKAVGNPSNFYKRALNLKNHQSQIGGIQ